MPASSWKAERGAERAQQRARRQKAKDKAKEYRKQEKHQLHKDYRQSVRDGADRGYARQQYQNDRRDLERSHQAEDWDKRQAQAHASYDRQYGAAAHRRNIQQMEQFARRREQDADFIRRAEAGEVDFEGDLAEIKTGKAWDQGQIDAYNDWTENAQKYKKDPQSFDYSSYFPDDPKHSRPKPTYEQYMGQYYDPNYTHQGGRGPQQNRNWQYGSQPKEPQYGNPYRR